MLVLIAAAVLAALAWVYLVAGHGGFWRTDQLLPPASAGRADQAPLGRSAASWPEVVAVVPARDEAAVLPGSLPTLLAQDYPGKFRIILVDDESTDGTADVAARLGAEAQAIDVRFGHRLRVISGDRLPPGWAGKVWAMAQGLLAAGEAPYVLFTDADIAYSPGAVSALVRSAQESGRVIISQMALLRADTFWERLLIPAFVYFFAQLYPFRRINKPGARTSGAAGGCMLVRRQALADAGGLDRIAGAISQRQYTGLSEIWDMVARSAYTQLRYSRAALAATVVGLAWLYLLPVAATIAGLVLLVGGPGLSGVAAARASWLAAAGFVAWALMSVTYVPVLRLSRLSVLRAPCLPLIGALYAAMTISSARRHHAGRGGEWKGRTIAQAGPSVGRQRP